MSLTLYIQMELCTTTLDKHLQKRNDQAKLTGIIDGEFNLSLYNQLLSALQYIHDDNIHIIHRDIKPANIFLKSDHRSYRILLGDFGLACGDSIGPKKDVLEEEETILVTPGSSKPRTLLTSGVGTVLYAAPEQRTQSNYYSAVDIYSAGIVLYEAYNIFSTSMERQRNIEKLKAERKVDEYLEKKWPSFAPVILSMTEVDPSKRPTAGQLLQQFKEDESASNLALQEIINSQNEKIVTLEKALAKATTADPCGGPVNSTQDQPGLFNSSQVASSSAQHQPQSPPMK